MQVKGLRLNHTCGFYHSSTKVSSEYLVVKYLDDWRANPNWKLVRFVERVYKDLGVHIGYYKAWYARARAKLTLYGDSAEEYARIFDYGFAILKYNPGSSAIVVLEGIERPPPFFQRMYVCLDACKEGFKKGCRPLLGVDGCHLKGAFSGMILVVVSKDGNNNIFPVAWAVVETDNKDSWTWFLELLIKDVGFPNGKGLTLDKQKGLIEAIAVMAPDAEVRFCARHIWANFKLKFHGDTFKEHFWKAARCNNKVDCEGHLACIRLLDEDAYNYLIAIPPEHWARHAFRTTSNSNMLLNNLCETFNAVLREAKDKPIITCLEWIMRYVMKRNTEKWEGVQGLEGKFMPYVSKVFKWISSYASKCTVVPSRMDIWEDDFEGDGFVVNLNDNTCTCFHWELTGIPCPHA
ncbi:uncharacterized protein LOC110694102 [Chenopodium quinoa]|uniref:uncharacterized protein LOC110694102 n=1 Tax=Chenopodium quinoa TaxID=63459 RepID=UPI000B791E71|nr:uncharacterized protein LOC110694102 [Chenopodium quinoa]